MFEHYRARSELYLLLDELDHRRESEARWPHINDLIADINDLFIRVAPTDTAPQSIELEPW